MLPRASSADAEEDCEPESLLTAVANCHTSKCWRDSGGSRKFGESAIFPIQLEIVF